jgi:glyoxylase-like metal-dependent hydrolase (beta-lactamase superfamily II)
VNTHNHFDHAGGIRTYVAEGATIITNAMNKPYYEQTFKMPRTLAPDKLSHSPKKATFITVKDKYVLSDGGREIDIIRVENNSHNEGILMVYIPKEKVLVEADDFTPSAPNGPPPAPRAVAFTKNLNANIQRLKLDVVTIAPLHGFVVPFAELEKLAGKGTT